jgi:hypothetical protein
VLFKVWVSSGGARHDVVTAAPTSMSDPRETHPSAALPTRRAVVVAQRTDDDIVLV